MFIQSLELFHYLPLMHQGTNRLSVPAFGKVNIVTGDNGSGKSSLMRELTPFASTKSDYDKDGYKKIVITHDGHTFELSSNFSRSAIHSFIRDGEELNLSGTGDVQNDLCRKHFGLTPEVEKLVDGKYKFTEMAKTARKELIMKTYPSSLEFILDYHNAIKSQIRGNNATLRNYNEREAKTKVDMVDESIYTESLRKQEGLRQIAQACDQDLYAIDIKLQDLRRDLESYPTSPTIGDLGVETENFRRRSQQHLQELLWMQGHPTYEKIVEAVRQMQNRAEITARTVELKEKAIKELAAEVDHLQHLLSSDTKDEIENCTRQIQAAKEKMAENAYDETIFIIHEEGLYQKFVQLAPKVREYLELVGSAGLTRLYTQNDADRIAHERDNESYMTKDLSNRITIAQRQIESQKFRIQQNSTESSIPPACKFTCGLKQRQAELVKGIEADIVRLEGEIKVNQQEYMEHAAILESKNKLLESISPYLDAIDYLNRLFTKDIWDDWFLEGLSEHKNFFELNSTHMALLQSKFAVMLDNSKKFFAYSKAAQVVKDMELKIQSLESSSRPAQDAIKELIELKTKQLDGMTEELDRIRKEEEENERNLTGTRSCQRLLEDIKVYREHIELIQKRSVTEFYIDALRAEKQWLQDIKHSCNLQELKIQEMIGKQSQLRTCLEHEILPAKEEIKRRLEKLQILEKALSPTSGIPHKYISRYLSSIFAIANHILSVCWDYEMSLAYVDEGDIDFSIQLVINSNSEVKDVSLGSLGQKSIVNLALILAILTYRHYIEQFPLKLDEVDIGLSPLHRNMLVTFLSDFVHSRDCVQVFLISHEAATNTGFSDAKIVSMSSNDLEAGYIGELISKRS